MRLTWLFAVESMPLSTVVNILKGPANDWSKSNKAKRNRQDQTSACFHLVHNLNVNGFNSMTTEKPEVSVVVDVRQIYNLDCYDRPLTHIYLYQINT